MNGARRHIQRAFAGAAEKYDEAAVVQRGAGERLLAGLPAMPAPDWIVDLGCGTGHGMALLGERWPAARLIGVDFALPMLRRLPAGFLTACGDAEAAPLAGDSVGLVWSNLALQWCEPRRFLTEAARLLRRGGRLAASTLGPGTFIELRDAFASVDGYRHTLEFATADELAGTIDDAGLRLVDLQRLTVTRRHPTLCGLLGEVRDIGANRIGNSGKRRHGLMGKTAWRHFESAYERYRNLEGLPLTYDLIFLYAENAKGFSSRSPSLRTKRTCIATPGTSGSC
jgi:malonyl-CoA O-methyltransferase